MKKASFIWRLLKVIYLISTKPHPTLEYLVQECETTTETFYRDLALWRVAGIPIYFDMEKNGFYLIDEYFIPSLNLTLEETLTLLLCGYLLTEYHEMADLNPIHSAINKMEFILPRDIKRIIEYDMDGEEEEEKDTTKNLRKEKELINALLILQQSIQERRKVEIRYFSRLRGQEIDDILDPYHLYYTQHSWYVVGYSADLGKPHTYKVSRFLKIVDTKDVFNVPAFKLGDYFGESKDLIIDDTAERVKVKFKASRWAKLKEMYFHPTQKLEVAENGDIIVTMTVNGLEEVGWWVLQYGEEAEIIEPPKLRTWIQERIKLMGNVYGI